MRSARLPLHLIPARKARPLGRAVPFNVYLKHSFCKIHLTAGAEGLILEQKNE